MEVLFGFRTETLLKKLKLIHTSRNHKNRRTITGMMISFINKSEDKMKKKKPGTQRQIEINSLLTKTNYQRNK